MSPTAAAIEAMYAQRTTEVPIELITVASADLVSPPGWPMRFAVNSVDIDSDLGGELASPETFAASVVNVTRPDDDKDVEPTVTLEVVGNFDLVVQDVRTVSKPPIFRIDLVLASDPNTLQIDPLEELVMRSFEATAFGASIELFWDELIDTVFPAHRYSPSNNPGLF